MRAVEIDLPSGERAAIVQSDGERATLSCPRPFPPGSTLEGSAVDGSGVYRIKVRLCRRSRASEAIDAVYEIEGRFIGLTRAQRARVTAVD